MSAPLAAVLLLVLLAAALLMDVHGGGRYVCPSCGATRENGHSEKCPWSRRPGA